MRLKEFDRSIKFGGKTSRVTIDLDSIVMFRELPKHDNSGNLLNDTLLNISLQNGHWEEIDFPYDEFALLLRTY